MILVKEWHGLPDLAFIVFYSSARALFSSFFGLALIKLISQLTATRAPLGSQKHAFIQGVMLGFVNLSGSFSQGLGLALLYAPGDKMRWNESLEYVLIARIGMSVLAMITVLFVPSFVYEEHVFCDPTIAHEGAGKATSISVYSRDTLKE